MARSALLLVSVLLLSLCLGTALAQSPPVWPPSFSIAFNETESGGKIYRTSGYYYYDAPNGRTRIDRADGKGDRYCGNVRSENTPCTHLVVNSTRYLVYPELNYCCSCCNAASGCGILKQNWLDGAVYRGLADVGGYKTEKWEKDGLQPNFYYQTVDTNIPVLIDQKPNDVMQFVPSTYYKGPIDPAVFKIPAYCTRRCPLFSICTVA